MTYVRITEVLGVNRNDVSKAISTLVAHDLLTVRKSEDDNGDVYAINAYWLRGHDRRNVES